MADNEKEYTIIVNGREKTVTEKKLSFADVVALAFGPDAGGPNIVFTVMYRRGENQKPKGSLVEGETVTIKNDMIFDVTRTDKS